MKGGKVLFAANMDLEECPLSKEELLRLVEEEAALRISASFLEQVGQGVVSNTFIISNRPRWNKRKERARQMELWQSCKCKRTW